MWLAGKHTDLGGLRVKVFRLPKEARSFGVIMTVLQEQELRHAGGQDGETHEVAESHQPDQPL